jgi:hypothetical protein
VFDPKLLATGAQKLYRWRINQDIAEHFIPRLVQKKYLKRKGTARDGIYIVDFKRQPDPTNVTAISDVLAKIINEFEQFPPRVTDLLNYKRSRDELTEILIRFVISLDAYGEAAFVAEVNRLATEDRNILDQLEEGGRPLSSDDRYMCARFVKQICKERPEFLPNFARLASIGLLTEVVEDFVKPVEQAMNVILTLVLDGPVALDYLGCSGTQLAQDVRSIVDSLRSIGCSVVVFPMTCIEIQNNLNSMLNLPKVKRHGYTHEAMARGEVMEDFVQTVAKNPEQALEAAKIPVRAITLEQFPSQHTFFDAERYEDFLATVTWGNDIAAKEHDTAALALTMRLREGKHNSDLFRCRYVFVTRNATFERRSRDYCLSSRLITKVQQGPIIHQRELATVAWLRTGLGASLDIPKTHLLATCDRVLRFRMEVQNAVAAKLQEVTPEKLEQFELLIQDHRSIRRLADETLNDERVVTAENAPQLLEAMRSATVEEEKAAFDAEMKKARERFNRRHRADVDALKETQGQLSTTTAALAAAEERERGVIDRVIAKTNTKLAAIEYTITAVLLLMGCLAVYDYVTGDLKTYTAWKIVLAIGGLIGLYHLIAHILQKHVFGVSNLLNAIGPWLCERALRLAELSGRFDVAEEAEFANGRMRRRAKPPTPEPQRLL